jgi:hypothetical protein
MAVKIVESQYLLKLGRKSLVSSAGSTNLSGIKKIRVRTSCLFPLLKRSVYFYSRTVQLINNPTRSNCNLIPIARCFNLFVTFGTPFALPKVSN